MNKRIFMTMLALLLCVVALASVLPSTMAFIAGRSNTVHNTFRVEYLPPKDVTVPVSIHKTVRCTGTETIGPEGFTFILENLDTGKALPITSLADGQGTAVLTFTADDVGKTYHYRLYEQNDQRANVVYDPRVYSIAIELQLNQQHEMSSLLSVDGKAVAELAVSFVNSYNVTVAPFTGDAAHPLLWLALLVLSCIGLVFCRKECMLWRP